MNILDIIILMVIAGCVLFFSYKGFVMAVFNLLSLVLSLFVAYIIYPHVSSVIRNSTGLFEMFKTSIADKIGLSAMSFTGFSGSETDIINSLRLPDFIKKVLIENNNISMRELLGAESVSGYISGFFANMLINAVSLVAVFLTVFIAIKLLGVVLDIASRLPVINTLNKLGGAVLGAIIGVVFLNVLITALSILAASQGFHNITGLLENSAAAGFFYGNNIWLTLSSKIHL